MFTSIINFSLHNRLLVLALSVLLIVFGGYRATLLPVDVLPDLSRPRVIVMAECLGMAPEEVETLVTVPMEMYLNGASGVTTLRSSSTSGLSVLTIEFDWSIDPFRCRQIVEERLQLARDRLPAAVTPRMLPMASMMGQVMYLTLWDEAEHLSPMELRSLADRVVRPRILNAGGVSEVLVIGGDVRQYQVLTRLDDMFRNHVTLADIRRALEGSSRNVTGGVLTGQGPDELLVRSIGRVETIDDLRSLVVKGDNDPPILLHQVADIEIAPAAKVGASGVYIKNPDGSTLSRPAVVLIVEKQVSEDTRALSQRILNIAANIQKTINIEYPDVRIVPLYQQQAFINLAIANVREALILGAILIVIVLSLFLMNLRATLITVLAMPVSIITACLIFAWFGLSINTMTLGGIAVAIGELVDDAIVDVENIYRRLRENFQRNLDEQLSTLVVVFRASCEIRNSIVYGTMIVVIVFFPIFLLPGMEGKMFAPMGAAYVVSILSSLVASITITPVLSFWLLPPKARRHRDRESWILRVAKWCAELAIRFSLTFPKAILAVAVVVTASAALVFFTLPRDFMPPFNEGAPQVNVSLAPGKSLATSEEIASRVAQELLKIDGVLSVVRKTGRAELDEHAVPVNMSEMLCTLDLKSPRGINEIFADIENVISPENLPGVVAFYDQPLQHLIAHLRTGTRAKIAIKVRGDDPLILRKRANQIQQIISGIADIGNPRIDPVQKDIPQVQFRLRRDVMATCGLIPEDVSAMIEMAMQGVVATQVLEGRYATDVLLRINDSDRENLETLAQIPIQTPSGTLLPLAAIAEIDANATGPSRIDHEAGQTQVTIQMNPRLRSSVDVKNDIDRALAPNLAELTSHNVHLEITGLFQSEQESSQRLLLLSCISLVSIFLVLYSMFGSANIVLQIMSSLPLALVGAVAAIVVTGQARSIPNLVGMIAICGIASRNGILIIDHYFHLMREEGESMSKEMIVRAGRDRVAPVLMTALTSMLGLLPLTFSPDTPGREILYPIATVVVGGLFTSTLTEFFVRPALFWVFGKKVVELRHSREGGNDERIRE
ncbi:MAG: efflux RND transporter permease subunit [Thermoguttaceae bacterium]